jgi:DNA-binding transcriptional regulator PaaX
MAATGWQEHSIRAALTGLRKAGRTVTRERNDDGTRYRIVGAA